VKNLGKTPHRAKV
jgi:hypothetical protein